MSKNAKIYKVFKGTDREFTGTKKEISEYFNINYYTLINRIYKQNMTLEKAINYKKCNNNFYIDETKMMNCGMKATIIEYFGTNNIIVKFEDGTIVKNKTYQCFKNGNISNPNINGVNKRLGETRLMNCGMKATIIEYFKSDNITVQFEDGTIVKNKAYNNFKKSNISNPNINGVNKRLGETRMMNCGMKATIIEYFRSDNITVQFEDGTIVKNRAYNNFKKSETMNPNLNYFTIFKGTNKEFKGSLKQISDNFNLNYGNLKNRIYTRNMTIEEAIELPLSKINQNNLNYKNKKGTMRELCKIFNKDYIEVYNKVKYNHTFEWAMDSTEKSYEEE